MFFSSHLSRISFSPPGTSDPAFGVEELRRPRLARAFDEFRRGTPAFCIVFWRVSSGEVGSSGIVAWIGEVEMGFSFGG